MIIEFKKNYKFYLSYLVLMMVMVGVSLYLYFTNKPLSLVSALLFSASMCCGILYMTWYGVSNYKESWAGAFAGVTLIVLLSYVGIMGIVILVHSATLFFIGI